MALSDEALTKIRQTWSSNPDYLDDLKERLTGAHPIPLVPFIGAGLSMPMGFPSWKDFLTGLAAECGTSDEVATLLAAGQYEEAAETVELALTPAIFHKRVTHTFGKRKSQACELRGAVLALPGLAGGPVVTTNFDYILERVFAEAGSPFEHVVWGSMVDLMRRAMVENEPFLLKIHGDAEDRSDRVLTKSEFEKRYAPGDPDGLRAQLGRLLQVRTLLFVGCSLGPDRTMDVLCDVLHQASGMRHFAIVEKPAANNEFFAKQRSLGERGILPIWYPAGQHELIEPLLRWIASLQPSFRRPGPELVLERPSQRKHEVRSELDLLIPYQRTTALIGRDAELESLQAWLRSEAAISVRVVTGGGGSGKTRLAVELIEWLDAAEPGQWNRGFLTQAEIERFSGLQNLSQRRRRQPVLAVVDYAAGSAGRLRDWLEQLAALEDGGDKLRLLLLEREASWDNGWLASTVSRGHSAAAVCALFDPPEPMRLESIAKVTDRRHVLRATVDAGASFRGVKAPDVPVAGVDAWFDRRLDDPLWGDPLTLMMAGLTALDTGLPAAMALGRADLAFRLADRERGRVVRFGDGAPPRLMEHMAAYVTVSGGLSREHLRRAAKAESEATGRAHPSGWGVLADCVAEALRGGDGAKPVEPDVIGEALLLRVWGGAELQEGCEAVVRSAKARGRQVAASVMRSAQDFCVGENAPPEPLAWLDALIAAGKGDLELLRRIEGELPQQTLALRERAVEVDTFLVAALQQRVDSDPDALPAMAGVLNNLGNRLNALGRCEEALAATEEALGIYLHLAAQRPDAFLPNLAASLDNLGVMLSRLGRREEALTATEKAVGIRRQLAEQRPDAFLPDLARSLNNLGNRLSHLGRREEAFDATDEAVGIYRQLATERPDAFLPDLARSLNNLGLELSALGRWEEALRATQEADGIYRQLAAERPDAFLPSLATSLNNLGTRLSALGRREEALRATEEAVGIRRQLATERPNAFLPGLAGSLNNLGNMLSAFGRREEALEAIEEAVRIRRQLATERPDAFLPDLASSLSNLGGSLGALGRWEEALEAIEEVVRIRRQLAAERPDAFLPDLATSLNNLGNGLSALGRREEALRATEEAVGIHRQLAAERPDAFLPDLATSLNNLGGRLSALGRREEALKATEEAVGIRRQLATVRPDAFLPDLATSLGAKGAILCEKDNAAALAVFREAIKCLKPLFLRQPAVFRRLMTSLILNYADACKTAGEEVDSDLLGEILLRLSGDDSDAAEV
jgi:tetratricopeptide (TPR) repeat protein